MTKGVEDTRLLDAFCLPARVYPTSARIVSSDPHSKTTDRVLAWKVEKKWIEESNMQSFSTSCKITSSLTLINNIFDHEKISKCTHISLSLEKCFWNNKLFHRKPTSFLSYHPVHEGKAIHTMRPINRARHNHLAPFHFSNISMIETLTANIISVYLSIMLRSS